MEAIVYAGIGLIIGAAFAALVLSRMGTQFKLTAQEAVQQAHDAFLQRAEENFKRYQSDGAYDLEKRQKAISELVDPIGKTLKEMEGKIENLGKAGSGLESQLRTFSDIQNRLRDETANLTRALRNSKEGGNWGEMHLQRTLEAIGMIEGTHFRRQVYTSANGDRQFPDFILDMPNGLHIVVDVKSPMDAYLEITTDNISDEQRDAALDRLRKALRSHLADLSKKEYWQKFNSPNFVVMYLPNEGLFSMAVSADSQLLSDAAQRNIIIASPTTFMGLARIAHYGWQQKNIADEARKIASLGADLYNRVSVFGDHMQKLGNNLNTAVKTYNGALGSLESKVLSGARKFKELHVQTAGKDIPEIPPIEELPRALSSPELLENLSEEPAKKRA